MLTRTGGAPCSLQEWAVKLVQKALEEAGLTPEQINVIAYTKVR